MSTLLVRAVRAASSLLILLPVLAPSQVLAQSSVDADIEEITVTSRYREENLSDVPDSITAFTVEDIEKYRIERINRIASLTPNLRFSDDQEVGVSTLVIRGVRQNRGTGQPPVSLRIDGVSATNNLLTTQELFDIESVDVLRGPQGALYGRNAIGGAVLISTRLPTDEPEYGLRIGAAQGEDFTLSGSASGPLGDDGVLYRASFRLQDREGQLGELFGHDLWWQIERSRDQYQVQPPFDQSADQRLCQLLAQVKRRVAKLLAQQRHGSGHEEGANGRDRAQPQLRGA